MRPKGGFIVAIVATLCVAGPAWADAIDGHWCHTDGRRFEIQGPRIVTPGRITAQGDYDRHHFAYVIPAGEAGAGTTVTMVLYGEMTVRLKAGDTAEETWNRCGPPVSRRDPANEQGTGNA